MRNKLIKIVGVPVMYGIILEDAPEDEDEALHIARTLIMELSEEVWHDEFENGDTVMSFDSLDWLGGSWQHTIATEVVDDSTEATEEGTSTTGRGLRSPVGDVQGARERDEGLPM